MLHSLIISPDKIKGNLMCEIKSNSAHNKTFKTKNGFFSEAVELNLFFPEFNSPVHRSAVCCFIIRNRTAFAVTDGGQSFGRNSFRDQIVFNGIGSSL
jgi:hypothetical protein